MKMSKLLSFLLFALNLKCGIVPDEGGGLPNADEEDETEVEVENNEDSSEENNNEEETNNESSENSESEEAEEVVVSIDGVENSEQVNAQQWVKDLRKSHRESQKRIKELETQLNAVSGATQKPLPVGEKPTLEGCDYDAEKFEAEYEAWQARKRQAEEAERKQQQEQENANKAWQEKLNGYTKSKTELKVKDFEDAEEFVKENFSVMQQGIIVKGCKNPALVVYALGKNPKKAKELAAIADPVEYAFAVATLENQLKVTNRKAAPPPEKTVKSGGTAVSGTVDNQLERLRADAEKTGDYSKVMAYKRQLRNKGK